MLEIDFKSVVNRLVKRGIVSKEAVQEVIDEIRRENNTIGDTPEWQAAQRIMTYLNECIVHNGKKHARVTKDSLAVLEKLLRIDKHKEQEVMDIITWCQSHDFWYGVILSPEKLRKHYDTMVAQRDRMPKPVDRTEEIKKKAEEFERKVEQQRQVSVPMPKGFKDVLRGVRG